MLGVIFSWITLLIETDYRALSYFVASFLVLFMQKVLLRDFALQIERPGFIPLTITLIPRPKPL